MGAGHVPGTYMCRCYKKDGCRYLAGPVMDCINLAHIHHHYMAWGISHWNYVITEGTLESMLWPYQLTDRQTHIQEGRKHFT